VDAARFAMLSVRPPGEAEGVRIGGAGRKAVTRPARVSERTEAASGVHGGGFHVRSTTGPEGPGLQAERGRAVLWSPASGMAL